MIVTCNACHEQISFANNPTESRCKGFVTAAYHVCHAKTHQCLHCDYSSYNRNGRTYYVNIRKHVATNHGITFAPSAVVRDAGVASSMAVTRAEQGAFESPVAVTGGTPSREDGTRSPSPEEPGVKQGAFEFPVAVTRGTPLREDGPRSPSPEESRVNENDVEYEFFGSENFVPLASNYDC